MATAASAATAAAGRVGSQRRSARSRMPSGAWWVVSVAFAAMFLYPLYVVITSSLKDPKEAAAIPPTLYPHDVSFDNYSALRGSESSINVFHNIGNSAMVS